TLAGDLPVAGVSITAPLKQACVAVCDELDEPAARAQAINTLVRGQGPGWSGYNFDVAGFLAPLDRRGLARAGERALVLGAGGAARAAVSALAARGVHVEVSARRGDAARALAAMFNVGVGAWPAHGRFDILVNSTPVGSWPHTGAAPADLHAVDARLV